MKNFVLTVLIVGGLLAAAWYLYDPHIKSLLGGSAPELTYKETIVEDGKGGSSSSPPPPASRPASPVKTTPAAAPVASSPATKPKTELDELLETRYPMPKIVPLLTIVDQWRNVPPNAYPPQIAAKEMITFSLVINGQVAGSSNVAPGTPLKPVQLNGEELVVASLANPAMNTRLHVDKTDFKERITAKYEEFVLGKSAEVEKKRERARQMIREDPSRMALLRGDAPSAGGSGTSLASNAASDPRFVPVLESLKRGDVASAKLSEARNFRWNGPEQIGGVFEGNYNTVTVFFEITTIFGEFPVEYKCLLQGARVVGWIDPITEDRA